MSYAGGAGPKARMPSQDGSDDIPPHLYEVAGNMAELSADRQAALMASMTEEERMYVQRAMDEAAIARAQLESEFRYATGPDTFLPLWYPLI